MSPRRRSSLPRPLSPSLEAPALYKAGLHAELQKFGQSRGSEQLLLWQDEEEPLSVTGLDLTVSEDKALSAIQILLHRTDYQGNRPGQEIHSQAFKWSGTLPVLAVTHSDFFEAYGLDRAGDGRYRGHQAEEALQALRSLAEQPRTVFYERKHWQGEGKARRQLSDIIEARAPLIKLTELTAYKDLEQDEAEQVKAGQELPDKIRATGLLIEPSPLLVDSIQDFYLLKPTTLHREIQQLLGSRRISKTDSLFLEWLLTKNTATVRIAKEKLIARLRLSKYIEQRHREIAEARIQEAVRVAKELGYLLDYQEDPTGTLLFELSPERCSRIKSQKPAKEEEEL